MTHLVLPGMGKVRALCGARERWPIVSTVALPAHERRRSVSVCPECRAIMVGGCVQLELL